MKREFCVGSLSNAALLERLGEVTGRDRTTTAEMLAVLAEVERRKLHRPAGYPSLFRYCVDVLRMSGDMAYKRIQVSRAARRFPQLLDLIADGRLHLTGARLVAPHLTRLNADDLLAAAVHRTTHEILVLLAERFPQPDVSTRIEPVGPRRTEAGMLLEPAGATTEAMSEMAGLLTGAAAPSQDEPAAAGAAELVLRPVVPSNLAIPAQSMGPLCAFPKLEPLSPGRHLLQTTIDQETHDLLRYAQALLSDAVPGGDVPEVLNRALRALVDQLERRKFGVGARLRSVKDPKDPRYTSPGDRCEVVVKDEGACTWVSDDGHRCGSRTRLRFHHKVPFAKGGPNTAANLTLHCAAHDQLEAEREYGEAFVQGKVAAARQERSTRRRLASGAEPVMADREEAHVLAAARHARSRGKSPADVLGSRDAAAEAQAQLDALLAGSA